MPPLKGTSIMGGVLGTSSSKSRKYNHLADGMRTPIECKLAIDVAAFPLPLINEG